ncbi:SDR family oxidoreductase [Haloarchaeobius amylolyticus]|uniref:SDR family oxidoreductase n=1 Tax=Haloarchaeobius amylolyticus TaxID=1198296 RepID=UPI00226FAE86|nr:SDR family oxidoreductase [Haloarchaeobius amylolyticus]
MDDPILVTGATGTVGAPLVDDLLDRGARVRAAVRNPATVTLPEAAETVAFDFERPETWGFALDGVERLFLLRPPSATRVSENVVPFVEAAARSGVEHCVVLSVLGAEKNPLLPHRRIEKAVAASGMRYTFLRASFFMQNFLTTHLEDVVEHDELFVPAGDGATSFVDARDVAAVAGEALTTSGHADRAYDVTGPVALTYHEAAEVFTEVLDRRITYPNPSAVAFARRWLGRGESPGFVVTMLGIYTTARLGLAGRVTDDARRVLGREPRDLGTFVADHEDAFAPRPR